MGAARKSPSGAGDKRLSAGYAPWPVSLSCPVGA